MCQPSDLRNGSSTLPTWRQIESRRHTARRQVSRLQIALKRADEGVARCAWVREDIFSDAFYCDAPHALRKRIAPRAGGPIGGEPRRRLICERDLHIHRISGNGSIEEKAIAKEWDDAVAPRVGECEPAALNGNRVIGANDACRSGGLTREGTRQEKRDKKTPHKKGPAGPGPWMLHDGES